MAIIKYIIADDHKIFRQGLRLALGDDHRLKFMAEAANGVELLEILDKQKPDVILLDLKMPEMDGMEAITHIRSKYPDIKIIILTMYDDEHFILHLLEAGANGYLVKNADPEEIKTAIHSACETGYYFSDMVSTIMLKSLMQKNKALPTFKQEITLNEKDIEVLKLICEGQTAAEIGKAIFLSPRTVEGIRARLLEKIGVKNTAGLVMYAARNGIV